MDIEKARELAQNAKLTKEEIEQKKKKEAVEDFYKICLQMIKYSAEKGEFERVVTIKYEKEPKSFWNAMEIVEETSYKLMGDKYKARSFGAFEHPVGISISWK